MPLYRPSTNIPTEEETAIACRMSQHFTFKPGKLCDISRIYTFLQILKKGSQSHPTMSMPLLRTCHVHRMTIILSLPLSIK